MLLYIVALPNHANLWDVVVGGDNQCRQEVVSTVTAQLKDGDLRASKDDWLGQVFHHERQCRGGVRHGVGTVEDDKTVVLLVLRLRETGNAAI